MKTNGGTINLSKVNNTQQIKVNRKLNNNNPSINNVQIYPDYYQYYNINQNKLITDENKHVKYESLLDPSTYDNNIIFTEYDSLPKYSINPTSTYKLSSNELRAIYTNTNGNINNRGNLIPINNQNKFKMTNINDDNYTNRTSMGRQRKVTSYKGYKRTNLFVSQNNNNSNMKENTSSSLINHRSIFQRGTKLNISKSEIQYPMNYFKNIPRSKSKIRSINKDNNNFNNNTDGENEDKQNTHLSHEKKKVNKNEQIGNYNISSPGTNFPTKKLLRQNKSNFAFINRRKNNILKPENTINKDHMTTMKTSNLNHYAKNENEPFNSYSSCYNFYQKDKIKKRLYNENNNIMNHTMNNFGLHNINSFQGNNNNINNLYGSITNHEICQNENENGLNYINIIEQDFQNNNIINNQNMNLVDNNINMNMPVYIRGNENIQISENINSLNNQEMQFNNILSSNKVLIYQKKIIEEFCHSLEEFIFINVKNNFDTFIFKLREYCKEKYFNELLFKRMQNKTIKKNFYKERASSYKYFEENYSKPFHSSILMNDSNKFINNREEYNLSNLSKGYIGRKTFNNYNKNRAPPQMEDIPRLSTVFRPGKSQGRLDKNNIDNYISYNNYYRNNNNYNNYNNNLYEGNYNNENFGRKTSTDRFQNNFGENSLYIPKKLKKKNDSFALNNKNEKSNNKKFNLFSYFNTVENHTKLNRLLSQENEVNKSHDINDDNIRAIKQNYNMNQLKSNIIMQDISYDNNRNDYIINKELGNGISNNNDRIPKPSKTQIKNNQSLENIKSNKKGNKPIYQKKIKITQAKSRITKNNNMRNNIKSKIISLNVNDNNNKSEQLINPNLSINNKNKNIVEKNKIREQKSFEENASNNLKQIKLTNSGEIKELSIDLSNRQNINGNISQNVNENNIKENFKIKNKDYDNGNNEIRKDINENNIEVDENNNEESNINDNNDNNENNTNNNDRNEMSNGNNVVNEDTDESEENVIKEIIVKDVSTRDKRLNVFIKYIEMQGQKNNSTTFSNNHLLCLLQTDSIYLPASRERNYYNNSYYYRNPDERNNKLKFQKILSSIIEEEEKSKAAGSVNNSSISEEEIYKNGNFTHFFIQSVKYLTSYLQSVFDDKRKDLCFYFFKTLKKIKNEAFLKGLMNQKKFQAFNRLKEEEENENNTSGDVILYKVNDNFNADINYFGSKSNDRKDIRIMRNKNTKNENNNKNGKDKNEQHNLKIDEEEIEFEEKYDTANNFCLFDDYNLNIIMKNMNLSIDNSCLRESKNKNNLSFSYFKEKKERKMNIKNKNYQKLKKVIENIEEYYNFIKIETVFKKWKQIKDENLHISEENDYEKHVTISEACRGLSDVILDFKIYLVKYVLKNKMNKEIE